MGVNIADIIERKKSSLDRFSNKIIAVDALNTIYQFLASIRMEDGAPLRDPKGRMVSHLSGILTRNANLIKYGIKPVYVFDGEPPELKMDVLAERKERKIKAEEDWKQALKEGDLELARTKAQQTSRITEDVLESAKKLLEYLGIPVVQAPSEGEAQASFMAQRNDVWAVASQDFDSILFGAPRLVRNITVSGRRKLPRQNRYINIEPEEIELEKVLASLDLSREQLIDIGILIGTDFNEGIKGIGPKKALKLVRKHKDMKNILKELAVDIDNYAPIREFFLNPPVTSDYRLEWKNADIDNVKKLLCDEHAFSEQRISKSLEKFIESNKTRSQKTLDFY
ncbi:MAG: flap endonuclease-1 [Thermoplasmata archaeon]|nr:MAG: flap endonuclease-1 [Thermoplasmata archaeon]